MALILLFLILAGIAYKLYTYRANFASVDSIVRTDAESGALTVAVDGREVVRIDEDGLHVSGDITYSSVLTDTGKKPIRTGGEGERPR